MTAQAAKMSQPQDWKLIVEKDVPIKLRDGAVIYCDVLRPDCKDKVPALMNIGPYQKDKLWRPPADLEEEANPYLNWETANPLWWCPRGYALIRVDSREIVFTRLGCESPDVIHMIIESAQLVIHWC